jgi:hypothetical protein
MNIDETTCVYCGKPVLTGNERPEHPVPHALGSSLEIFAVCDPCNTWASVNVDQPFLRDGWVRWHRADHDIRDPRRPHRAPPHPLRAGFTDEGVRVTIDAHGRPTLGAKIIEETSTRVRIRAGSLEEANRLRAKAERRAAAEGYECRVEREESSPGPLWVNIDFSVDVGVWAQMAAKVALGIGSLAYQPEWRTSDDAHRLRCLLRDDNPHDHNGRPVVGLMPARLEPDNTLRFLAEPPEHVIFFQRSYDGAARVHLILFGEMIVPMVIDTADREVPTTAWVLDPRRPRANGETTFDELMIAAVRRAPRG